MKELGLKVLKIILGLALFVAMVLLLSVYFFKSQNTWFLIDAGICFVCIFLNKIMFDILIRYEITKTDQEIREKVKSEKKS